MRNNSQAINRSLQLTQILFSLMMIAVLALAAKPSFANGSWTKKSFAINGSWSIVEKNGANVLVLGPSFKTKSAPDLKIFLSTNQLSELNGRNATNGSVLISPLKSNKGAQEYVIPANIDISQYQSLIIHCEAYSKLWGGSAL